MTRAMKTPGARSWVSFVGKGFIQAGNIPRFPIRLPGIVVFAMIMGFCLIGCTDVVGDINSGYFEFDSELGTITDYDDDGPKNVKIPATIAGVTVTAIAKNAFRGKRLTGVTIGNEVVSIGEGAFAENRLTSVTIGGVVTIGKRAFEDNLLKTVIIPNSVVIIENNAFAGNQLSGVGFGSSLTAIGAEAFAVNQIVSVKIPDSVIFIDTDAFSGNRITSVTIGPNKNYASSIIPKFGEAYNANGKQEGTYMQMNGDSWVKQ